MENRLFSRGVTDLHGNDNPNWVNLALRFSPRVKIGELVLSFNRSVN